MKQSSSLVRESRAALSSAREQAAVLQVLIGQMNAALRQADLDNGTELGAEVGPYASKLAADLHTNLWAMDSHGGAR